MIVMLVMTISAYHALSVTSQSLLALALLLITSSSLPQVNDLKLMIDLAAQIPIYAIIMLRSAAASAS